jgi:hypothetical protein
VKTSVRSDLPFLIPALASALLALGGCYYPADASPGYAPGPGGTTYAPADSGGSYTPPPQPGIPTSLVVVMPDDSTASDYAAQREQIVSYLIDRGYINSESELIGDPDEAARVVRAIVSNGGFTLSVFSKDTLVSAPVGLETTDLFLPEDPYFIWDFTYVGEIGRRRLPPPPPNYRPHPRPPGSRPVPGHVPPDFGHHWPRPGGSGNHPSNGSYPGNPNQGHLPAPGTRPGNPPGTPGSYPGNGTPPNTGHQTGNNPGNPPPPDHRRPGGPETTGPSSNPPQVIDHGRPSSQNESSGNRPPSNTLPRPPAAPQTNTHSDNSHSSPQNEPSGNHAPVNGTPRASTPVQNTSSTPHNNPPPPPQTQPQIEDHSRGRTPQQPPAPANTSAGSKTSTPSNPEFHSANGGQGPVQNNRPPPPPMKVAPAPHVERSSTPPPPKSAPPASDDKKAQN